MLGKICAYCQDPLPPDVRLGAAYCKSAHRQAAYRQRVKLKYDSMYMKVDATTALIAVPANRLVTANCTVCPSHSLLELTSTKDRSVQMCVECRTIIRRRI